MVADDLFSDHIYTFNYNEYKEEFEFPASEAGWIVEFFPSSDGGGFIQYDVKQTINDQKGYHAREPWNVTYSQGCHGFMQGGDYKICTIKNFWIKHSLGLYQIRNELGLRMKTRVHRVNVGSHQWQN